MTLLERLRDLQTRASVTSAIKITDRAQQASRNSMVILERRESLDLNAEAEQFIQGMLAAYNELETMVFELAAVTTRGSNGHTWKQDLPPQVNPSEFYQKLHQIVRYSKQKSLALQNHPHDFP